MITCYNVFNVWPKTTLLPVWCRDAKSLDTPFPTFDTLDYSSLKMSHLTFPRYHFLLILFLSYGPLFLFAKPLSQFCPYTLLFLGFHLVLSPCTSSKSHDFNYHQWVTACKYLTLIPTSSSTPNPL